MSNLNDNQKNELLNELLKNRIETSDTISQFMEKCNINFSIISQMGGGHAGVQGEQGSQGIPAKPKVPIHVWVKGKEYKNETETETDKFELIYDEDLTKEKYQAGHLIMIENAHVYILEEDGESNTLKPNFIIGLQTFDQNSVIDGKDGESWQYIFYNSNIYPFDDKRMSNPANWGIDDGYTDEHKKNPYNIFIKEESGWHTNHGGVSDINKYEYQSFRRWDREKKEWEKYSEPTLYSNYSEGGNGYSIIFSNPTSIIYVDNEWKTIENITDYTYINLYKNQSEIPASDFTLTLELDEDYKEYFSIDNSEKNKINFNSNSSFEFTDTNTPYKLPITIDYEYKNNSGETYKISLKVYWTLLPIRYLENIELFVDKKIVNITTKKNYTFKAGYYLTLSNGKKEFIDNKNNTNYNIIITNDINNINDISNLTVEDDWSNIVYNFTTTNTSFYVILVDSSYTILDCVNVTSITDGDLSNYVQLKDFNLLSSDFGDLKSNFTNLNSDFNNFKNDVENNYVSNTSLDKKLEDYAKKDDIPNVDRLSTKGGFDEDGNPIIDSNTIYIKDNNICVYDENKNERIRITGTVYTEDETNGDNSGETESTPVYVSEIAVSEGESSSTNTEQVDHAFLHAISKHINVETIRETINKENQPYIFLNHTLINDFNIKKTNKYSISFKKSQQNGLHLSYSSYVFSVTEFDADEHLYLPIKYYIYCYNQQVNSIQDLENTKIIHSDEIDVFIENGGIDEQFSILENGIYNIEFDSDHDDYNLYILFSLKENFIEINPYVHDESEFSLSLNDGTVTITTHIPSEEAEPTPEPEEPEEPETPVEPEQPEDPEPVTSELGPFTIIDPNGITLRKYTGLKYPEGDETLNPEHTIKDSIKLNNDGTFSINYNRYSSNNFDYHTIGINNISYDGRDIYLLYNEIYNPNTITKYKLNIKKLIELECLTKVLDVCELLTFTAKTNGSTIEFEKLSSNQTIEYSTDAIEWHEIQNESYESFIILLNDGEKVHMKGVLSNNNTLNNYTQFKMAGEIEVSGNCNVLWSKDNLNAPLRDYCGYNLFKGCESLTNVQKTLLPATKLVKGCYSHMFEGCTSLTTSPKLPATSAQEGCYSSMFSGCTSLTEAPVLPATTLAVYCYSNMFEGCTKLTQAPVLPATTLSSACYAAMFKGCTNLNYIKCLATGDINNVQNWVYGVSSNGTFVKSTNSTWETGINGIPEGWDVKENNGENNINTKDLLTLTAKESGSTIGLNSLSSNQTLEYSTDTITWSEMNPSMNPSTIITLNNVGDKVYLRGELSGNNTDSNFTQFAMTGKIAASGNCNALWNYKDLNAPLQDYCGYRLFFNCPLITAPELPATTLAEGCYRGMFSGCTSLTTAPELPATKLKNYCYAGMFSGCTYLTEAPELPATTLAEYCYNSMFYGCDKLITTPELPATTLASDCYNNMFYGCISLTTAPEQLPATTLAEYCYYCMFYGCTSLTTSPELPATTLASNCYDAMFSGCTSLTTVPEQLPATTLAERCYGTMFSGCTSLTTVPEQFLPATTLASDCYGGMFSGCHALTTAPELPATTLAEECYSYMFSKCKLLNTAPALPATTLTEECYYSMFANCTSLTTAPDLPATTLVNNCYKFMFQGCNELYYIKCLATDISATNCTDDWVSGVPSGGKFVQAKDVSWSRGVDGIPTNWTIEKV